MSKIKSLDQLIDRLNNESLQRKHELISVRQMLPPASHELVELWVRIAPVIAYAHWEGFVKVAATSYLNYLSSKSLALSRLRPSLQALACRAELLGAVGATKRIAPHLAIVDRLIDRLTESVTVPHGAIDTESNLNWEVFENICNIVGIQVSGFWSQHRGLVDDMFITRCEVAHGQLLKPEAKQSVQYLEFVLMAISNFSADLMNAALTEAHLRPQAG